MARALTRLSGQGLAYRVTVRGRNWTGSAVDRASVADERPGRMSSFVTDPRGFQEFGGFLERLLHRGRRLRGRRP